MLYLCLNNYVLYIKPISPGMVRDISVADALATNTGKNPLNPLGRMINSGLKGFLFRKVSSKPKLRSRKVVTVLLSLNEGTGCFQHTYPPSAKTTWNSNSTRMCRRKGLSTFGEGEVFSTFTYLPAESKSNKDVCCYY